MSGTNRSKDPEWSPDGPVAVLVRPQLGENIGAAARALWNFGLDRMRLVAPRDGWPNPRAIATASGASRVIDAASVHESTGDAVADLHYVYATTARNRDLVKQVLTPEAAMADARARVARGEKVGVLFGPERSGLENDDIARAQALIAVPTNPAFASLNLGQCVLLTAYEWRRQSVAPAPAAEVALAPRAGVERMLDHLDQELEAANYFWPEDKRPALRENIRNLFHRAPLTEPDVRTLWGVIRALAQGRPRR